MNNIVRIKEPSYRYIRDTINALIGKYTFLEKIDIGNSYLRRKIFALKIGKSKEKVLYTAAFHGSEWITALILLKFTERICESLNTGEEFLSVNLKRALKDRSIIIVPCVNPDGVEIALKGAGSAKENKELILNLCENGVYNNWQSNARGVDINHNFNAGWEELHKMEKESGISSPCRSQYGGVEAHSEAESRALVELCELYKFRHVIALHSQGEEIYWQYGDKTPERSRLMAGVMSALSGYSIEEVKGLASHGGFKDWFIERFNKPGFTIEIGKGINPLPISDFDSIYNRIEEMLLLASLM